MQKAIDALVIVCKAGLEIELPEIYDPAAAPDAEDTAFHVPSVNQYQKRSAVTCL